MDALLPPALPRPPRTTARAAARLVAVLVALAMVAATPGAAEAKKRKRRREVPVAALTRDGLPNVQAKGAIVLDLESGEELYARDPDGRRPIASTTKIFVGLVVRAAGIDLEGETEITEDDQRRARGGARSRLTVGRRFKNIDLLRAMLIASDNRACTALARAAGLSPEQLIERMNGLARKLGLKKTRFVDTSGLRGNDSTPRELAVALVEAMRDPVLLAVMSTPQVDVRAVDAGEPSARGKNKKKPPYSIHYNNTNVSLRTSQYKVLAGKTGYTDPARYCLAIAAQIAGRRVVMIFLGVEGELTRFADFQRVAGWLTDGATRPTAGKRRDVGALADPPVAVAPRLAR